MKKYILFIVMFLASCTNKKIKDFEKILTNESTIWIFYEGNYDHYKNVSFDTKYKFFKNGTYKDVLSPKPFGTGKWTTKNNMIQINADSYNIVSFNADSIILQNKSGLQARFINIKSPVAKKIIQYKLNDSDLQSVP